MTDRPPPRTTPSGWRRVFGIPNLVSVGAGVACFYVLLRALDSTWGALIAGAAGGIVTALVWLVWDRITGLRPVAKLVDVPGIGSFPVSHGAPTPTLTAPESPAGLAFQRAASRLEASTRGRVLLVSGMTDGQGATTAALNLAIAATRAGRRTLLIDGDADNPRLSRFGRTGVSPGLTEVVAGEVAVSEASRLWAIDTKSRLPFIPAGRPTGDEPLQRTAVSAALDDITTAADLVLIDTAAHAGRSLDALGSLADGTLLVLPKAADRGTIDAVTSRLSDAGAPPIGYLVNDAAPSPPSVHQNPVLRSMKRAVATALLVLVAYGAWNGFQVWNSWRNVERHQLDVAAASEVLPLPEFTVEDDEGLDTETVSNMTAIPAAEGDFLSVLLVGTDLSGDLADVITLVVIPRTDEDPVMVSIPRDLYVTNRCTGAFARINSNFTGCGDVEGETMLALAVEDYTGIHVDHMAVFTFDGFEEIIDTVGGIEICLEYPVRDAKAELDLPAGCTQATGAQALSWVRSRRTQELVDGSWRTMSNVSDLTRNQRQQDVILHMFSKLGDFSSVDDLTATTRSLIGAFSLDEGLGLTEAINLAWSLKDIDPGSVQVLEIPVADEFTDTGAAVLVATQPFDSILGEVFPDLAPSNNN